MKKKYSLEYFSTRPWSFVLIDNDKIIFKSILDGLKPLISCIKKNGQEMKGATVYDKIIGRAAATLLSHAQVKAIWTPTVSMSAKEYLSKKNIALKYINEVENIMNREGNGFCPMEKMSRELGEKEFVKKMLEK